MVKLCSSAAEEAAVDGLNAPVISATRQPQGPGVGEPAIARRGHDPETVRVCHGRHDVACALSINNVDGSTAPTFGVPWSFLKSPGLFLSQHELVSDGFPREPSTYP